MLGNGQVRRPPHLIAAALRHASKRQLVLTHTYAGVNALRPEASAVARSLGRLSHGHHRKLETAPVVVLPYRFRLDDQAPLTG